MRVVVYSYVDCGASMKKTVIISSLQVSDLLMDVGPHTFKNQKKEIVMEQVIHITLRFNLATGKVGLNEIVYKLKEIRDPLMLKIFG